MTLSSTKIETSLYIGDDATTGQPQYYSGDRGLVTIAAPGSGKTQCHMLPNLLKWPGPAVVLDVTGELWQKTSKERRRFGPVYLFDASNAERSDYYNPFSAIRSDLENVWQDAEVFAGLLSYNQSSSSGGGDGHFYDIASKYYLITLATFIARYEQPAARNMGTLLKYVSGVDLKGFLSAAASKSELPALQAAAAALKVADDRTLGNVIWSARNFLGPWNDPKVLRICSVSDWQPQMIRDHNATLYIHVPVQVLSEKPALVRLIIGQHLNAFMAPTEDPSSLPLVQFFIDEAPQLRHMSVLTNAIETGRYFKVRLWLVMQWRGQLIRHYGEETARGMIASCGLQAYMNPSMEDGGATAVSENIGYTVQGQGFSGVRRPLKSPQELVSSKYNDTVITFDEGYHELRKHPFRRDPELVKLAGASP